MAPRRFQDKFEEECQDETGEQGGILVEYNVLVSGMMIALAVTMIAADVNAFPLLKSISHSLGF